MFIRVIDLYLDQGYAALIKLRSIPFWKFVQNWYLPSLNIWLYLTVKVPDFEIIWIRLKITN